MPDSNPRLLSQKSGALPMSHHISPTLTIVFDTPTRLLAGDGRGLCGEQLEEAGHDAGARARQVPHQTGFNENLNDNELYLVIDCIVLGIPFRIRKLYTYTVLILISLFHLFPQYASEFKKSFDREKFNNQKFYFLKFFSFFNF